MVGKVNGLSEAQRRSQDQWAALLRARLRKSREFCNASSKVVSQMIEPSTLFTRATEP